MEPEILLPFPQEPVTGPNSKPDESSLNPRILFL
jgi:hypothetical protein